MRRAPAVLFVAALLTLSVQLAVFAAGKTVSPRTYAQALSTVRATLDRAATAVDKDEDLTDEMPGDTAKRELGAISSIRLPDGTVQPVDTKSLVAAIRASDNAKTTDDQSAGYKAVSRRLEFLRNECLDSVKPAASSEKSLTPSKSTALARDILSRSAFSSEPIPPPSWMERQMNIFGKWL